MFDPSWDKACDGCAVFVNDLPELAEPHRRDTSLAIVARAPEAKLEAWRRKMGWEVPLYSSFGSDFNDDFHVTTDETAAPSRGV